MSALGQKRTLERPSRMSALPPKADITRNAKTPQCTGPAPASRSCAASQSVALRTAPRGVAFSVTREELVKHNTTDCQFGLRLQLACKPWWLLCDGTVGGDWYAYSFLSVCLRGVCVGDAAL